jgi:hypothetical protein
MTAKEITKALEEIRQRLDYLEAGFAELLADARRLDTLVTVLLVLMTR